MGIEINSFREELLYRFLNYVSIDTQSDPNSNTTPSTTKQFDLLRLLEIELLDIGLKDVTLDNNGYLIAHIPASKGYEELAKLCFCSHIDTSPEMNGKNVTPQIIDNYDGENIHLGNSGYILSPDKFIELKDLKGHTIVTTDGNTLLGADDKAGIAEIITAIHFIISNDNIKHGDIRICFTPDEEIGRGVDKIDLNRLDSDFAYTMDGSKCGELEFECFNAASALVNVKGCSIHPGYAKDKMINAIEVFNKIHSRLPEFEKPECTEHYQGFYHIISAQGDIENFKAQYIIRDFDRINFEKRKDKLRNIVDEINNIYEGNIVSLSIEDSYYNMKEKIEPYPFLIDIATKAMEDIGIKPLIRPIRGGTDGARLSYMGLPCPNIFTGGMNFHGRYEYISLDVMVKATNTIINIIRIWTDSKIKNNKKNGK